MFRKILHIVLEVIFIFTSVLFAQDIDTGVKLINFEKYTNANKYFSSMLNTDSRAEAFYYLGEIYLIMNKPDSAKICFENGIESKNEFPLNYAGLVKINLIDGNLSEAYKNQAIAIDLGNNKNSDVYIALSEAYSKIGYYDKAIDLLNTAQNAELTDKIIYLTLGKTYLSRLNGSEAIKDFDLVLKMDPVNVEALSLKAKVYFLINNYNEAITLLNNAITIDPAYPKVYKELSDVYSILKDYSKAAEYYSKYIDASEVTIEKQKEYASLLYLNKEYEKAISILMGLIKVEPENSTAIRILAYSYLRNEQYDCSKYFFKELFALHLGDYLSSDYENYAELLSQSGNDSLAIEYLDKIIQLDSTRKDILGKISVINFKDKNWYGVISALERKGELTAQEFFDLGKAYYFLQDYSKADSAFNQLSLRIPDLTIAYFWQARVKANFDPESELGLARPFYEKFISLSGEDTVKYKKELIEAYSYMGYYFYLAKDNNRSKSFWQKVYALDPQNVQAIEALKKL